MRASGGCCGSSAYVPLSHSAPAATCAGSSTVCENTVHVWAIAASATSTMAQAATRTLTRVMLHSDHDPGACPSVAGGSFLPAHPHDPHPPRHLSRRPGGDADAHGVGRERARAALRHRGMPRV